MPVGDRFVHLHDQERSSVKYVIEEIRPEFDHAIGEVIRKTGIEYGAIGEGFGPSDPEVSMMSRHYSRSAKSLYLVARIRGRVVGGCGIASFAGSDQLCELRKLFLRPERRGLGIGKALTLRCLAFAASQGYRQCYLDTLSNMTSAITLYETLGFKRLDRPLGGTIHGGCDVWMLKDL